MPPSTLLQNSTKRTPSYIATAALRGSVAEPLNTIPIPPLYPLGPKLPPTRAPKLKKSQGLLKALTSHTAKSVLDINSAHLPRLGRQHPKLRTRRPKFDRTLSRQFLELVDIVPEVKPTRPRTLPKARKPALEGWAPDNWHGGDALVPKKHAFSLTSTSPSSSFISSNKGEGWFGPDCLPEDSPTPPAGIKLDQLNTTSHIPKRQVHGTLQSTNRPVLADLALSHKQPDIAVLSHGLERVLFNPGVHWLQDPRSRVYNFTPWLQTVPKVSDFDFDRIPGFVPSSRDKNLRTLAQDENRRFAGSTSSLSGILSQCYFLISEHKDVDTSVLSLPFRRMSTQFSPSQRWPANVVLNYKRGVYTVDSAKYPNDPPEKNILTWLGTLLEKFLTVPSDEFSTLLKSTPLPKMILEILQKEREAYRYSKSKDFVMRSQLDCYDPRLPGTGVFDIKTRACMPTRLDVLNYEEHAGYTIKKMHGELESFEKEYYDLIRSAFLKYSFQVRIGNMDGVIVAYHNTESIFGFQYIPLTEMDERLFGPGEGVGERVFEKCVGLMEKIMAEAAGCFVNRSCKATLLAREGGAQVMDIWVEPLEWDGDEEHKPIEQLTVNVNSYLGGDPVRGRHAVSESRPDLPWTLEYKITHLDIEPEVARAGLTAAHDQVMRSFQIPSGVDYENLEEYWHSLTHGNAKETTSTFDPSMFTSPRPYIQKLREMSRMGREAADELEKRYKDKPKIVLGHA